MTGHDRPGSGAPDAEPASDAIAALQARGRFGIRLGLGRIRALLGSLGSPEAGLPGVLIGGTNGKGSVQAMVAAVLLASGQRVGQTPKPHLVDYRERILIDGRMLDAPAFDEVLRIALAASDATARRHGPATEFEILTAAAFLAFARAGIELAVVEVGLGGRLDATNAWDGGVAAVTNVALDHTAHLGPTERAIGREKAAIIKRGDLAVTGAAGAGLEPIRRRAARFGVPLTIVGPPPVLGMDRAGLHVELPGLGEARVGLLGRHQAANAAVAVAVVDALRAAGLAAPTEAQLRDGLAAVRWPGRLELLALGSDGRARASAASGPAPGLPDLLLDGAHNPAGMAAFVAALEELRPSLSPGPPTLLVGLMADKDVAGMVTPLAASAALRGARIITSQVDDERALPAGLLADAWEASPDAGSSRAAIRAVPTLGNAVEAAVESALRADGPLLVVGSLYLVGAVRDRLVGRGDVPR